MTVFVLWENHSDGPVDRFGPHVFLVACIADRLLVDRFELHRSEAIRSRSCNGNSNVFRELGRSHPWNTAPHVIAVLDSDKLHELLGGEARKLVAEPAYEAWSAQMEGKCRERIGAHGADQLAICFLDRNLETLLQALGDTSVKKNVVQRDKLLQRAAADPALIRRALEQMPSWAHLVEAVAHRVRP